MIENTPSLTYSAQPKISTQLLSSMQSKEDLSKAYTPGIAEVCKLIQADPDALFTHTFCRNNLAVISNGTAVLGLGDIGPRAAYPVMEGKSMLFKRFANIDAIPIVINAKSVDEFVETVVRLANSFGAINLEDIKAPECFEIERKLKERLSIPVMHDDQHGTAVVVLAAVLNALSLMPKSGKDSKVVIVGAGAAGLAITQLLLNSGFTNLVMVDSKGIVSQDRSDLNSEKQAIAQRSNPEHLTGSLETALIGADIFIGVSKAGLLDADKVRTMATDPIIIAMANPVPEIMPDEAKQAGVGLMATGRSDFANQVNNALAFPGIFRAAIDARTQITEAMKIAAAEAIVEYHQHALSVDNLMPSILDQDIHTFIAQQVQRVISP